MGLFDKFKKKNTEITESETAATEITVSETTASDTPVQESTDTGFSLGVTMCIPLPNAEDIVVCGRLKGTAKIGDAIHVSNPGDDEGKMFSSSVISIENEAGEAVSAASDCAVKIRIEKGKEHAFKIGSVVYTRGTSTQDVMEAYTNALGDGYVLMKKMELTAKDLEKISIAECAEVWKLFMWFLSRTDRPKNEQEQKENKRKVDTIARALCDKLLAAEEVYCVYNKKTGEPHLFSRTGRQAGGFVCTPPTIMLLPKAYKDVIFESFSAEVFDIKKIENGEKKDGIYNFLGSAFYLNGACGVNVVSDQVEIAAPMLVAPIDYSKTKPVEVPVTNPDLMRWMLLLGQIGKPKTPDEQTVYKLYYRFAGQQMVKAKFLIPMRKDTEFPKADADGKVTVPQNTSIYFPTIEGMNGRGAVRMYTDWTRLRMVYDEEWDGMIQPIEGMIDRLDCAINLTQNMGAGCYVSKEMYEEMKKF